MLRFFIAPRLVRNPNFEMTSKHSPNGGLSITPWMAPSMALDQFLRLAYDGLPTSSGPALFNIDARSIANHDGRLSPKS
jgi:hypothetical protein